MIQAAAHRRQNETYDECVARLRPLAEKADAAPSLPPGCTLIRQGEWFEVRSREDARGRADLVADGQTPSEAAAAAWAAFGRFVPREEWERLVAASGSSG
jgi:hypothetical protein